MHHYHITSYLFINNNPRNKYKMMNKKEVQSTVIQSQQWMIISTYLGKASPLSHDRNEERIKIIVSSLNKANFNEFMYTFDIVKLEDYKLVDSKEFKNLKEFHHYLKFNPENVRFKVVRGEGVVSVMFATNQNNKNVIAKIVNGTRFLAEENKEKDIRIQKELERLEEQRKEKEKLDKLFQERPDYPKDICVIDRLDNMEVIGLDTKKLVIRSGFMDADSEQCEMKNDREIDRLAISKLLQLFPKLTSLESLTIQWHKMSNNKQINEIIKACSNLNLKALNFDNLSNDFDNKCLQAFQKLDNSPLQNIEDLNIYFNISDEDNYFDEAWWHPQHTQKYKGKSPIDASQWEHFLGKFKNLQSIWIPKNTEKDIELLNKAAWKKLAIGWDGDLQLKQQYWNEIIRYCKEKNADTLQSLCLTRIKDIKQAVLIDLIRSHRKSLQYFMLNWCDRETQKCLEALLYCENLKYLHLRHSPLQQNKEVKFEFLTKMAGLEFLSIDNFKEASKGVDAFLGAENSNSLKQFGAPRNDWISVPILTKLSQKPNLTKLNLFNVKLVRDSNLQKAAEAIGNCQYLKVLNIGSSEFTLNQVIAIVKNLKYLKKLNISDIKCQKVISSNVYEASWKKIQYPKNGDNTKKAYEKLTNDQKKEFLVLLNNIEMEQILPLIPRVTHFDIRNLGIDQRPFMNPKNAPCLKYIGCEFELYKKLQTLQRRGVTFV